MDDKLIISIIGIFSGVSGYWLNIFVMQPILRFRDARNQILKDFIYFAQVVNAEGLNDDMKALHKERILANRKASAQLSAAMIELPRWYLHYLNYKGIAPAEAAINLIGFSNTYDHSQSYKLENAIRRKLGLPKT